jgi:uncharacterized OB-fold protein
MTQGLQVAVPEPHRDYIDHLAAGRLVFQRCQSCAAAIFYPRVLCPTCGSTDLAWAISEGLGTIYATTVVSERNGDYVVCLVDVDEGFRLMSTVLDVEPIAVRIGQRVRATIEPGAGGAEPRVVMELEPTHGS